MNSIASLWFYDSYFNTVFILFFLSVSVKCTVKGTFNKSASMKTPETNSICEMNVVKNKLPWCH